MMEEVWAGAHVKIIKHLSRHYDHLTLYLGVICNYNKKLVVVVLCSCVGLTLDDSHQ